MSYFNNTKVSLTQLIFDQYWGCYGIGWAGHISENVFFFSFLFCIVRRENMVLTSKLVARPSLN